MKPILLQQELLSLTHFCVIVPTYNNHKTLKKVLDSVLDYTTNIIIVNDGSTDETSEILKSYSHLIQIHHPKNLGKGRALRNGLRCARRITRTRMVRLRSGTPTPRFAERGRNSRPSAMTPFMP